MRINTVISATSLLTVTQLCCALPTKGDGSLAVLRSDAFSVGSFLVPSDSATDNPKPSEGEIDEKADEVKGAADKKNPDDDVNMDDIIDVATDAGSVLNNTLAAEAVDGGDKAERGHHHGKEKEYYDIMDHAAGKLKGHFHSYTALGDSYSSGDAALNGWGNGQCRRNDGSYPFRLNKVLQPTSFQFQACSGADTAHINQLQVKPESFGKPDLVTITAGGDDGGSFVKILLACILQGRKKKCDSALAHGQETVKGLTAKLVPLYKEILAKGGKSNRTLVVLGYVQLYDRDGDKKHCPKGGVDFTWPSTGKGGYRDQINKMVLAWNDAIQKAVLQVPGAVYADVDAPWEGHRFCDGKGGEAWMQHKLGLGTGGIVCHPTFEGHGVYLNRTLKALGLPTVYG